jgi:hypothetical protein
MYIEAAAAAAAAIDLKSFFCALLGLLGAQ